VISTEKKCRAPSSQREKKRQNIKKGNKFLKGGQRPVGKRGLPKSKAKRLFHQGIGPGGKRDGRGGKEISEKKRIKAPEQPHPSTAEREKSWG